MRGYLARGYPHQPERVEELERVEPVEELEPEDEALYHDLACDCIDCSIRAPRFFTPYRQRTPRTPAGSIPAHRTTSYTPV